MVEIENTLQAGEAFRLAVDHEENGKHQKALEIREALVQFTPSDAHFLIGLGQTLTSLERFEKAEVFFKTAIELHPEFELASTFLFHFYWDQDLTDLAFEEIKRFQSISHSEFYMDLVRQINSEE